MFLNPFSSTKLFTLFIISLSVFDLFKKYSQEKERLCNEYEKLYGPLEVTGTTGSKFDWIDSPWPWENKGGSMYV